MKTSFLSFVLAAALSSALADSIDITNCPDPKERKSLSVSKGETVLIELPDGHTAVVQFTDTGDSYATYRWRYRPSPDVPIKTGTGRVFEDNVRIKQADGTFSVIKKHKPEDLKIQAGDIWLEWSFQSTSNGWVYFCPVRAKLRIIPSDQFESKP